KANHIYAALQEFFRSLCCQGRIAKHDGHDGMLAGSNLITCLGHTLAKDLGVVHSRSGNSVEADSMSRAFYDVAATGGAMELEMVPSMEKTPSVARSLKLADCASFSFDSRSAMSLL